MYVFLPFQRAEVRAHEREAQDPEVQHVLDNSSQGWRSRLRRGLPAGSAFVRN